MQKAYHMAKLYILQIRDKDMKQTVICFAIIIESSYEGKCACCMCVLRTG